MTRMKLLIDYVFLITLKYECNYVNYCYLIWYYT